MRIGYVNPLTSLEGGLLNAKFQRDRHGGKREQDNDVN